MTKAPNRQRLPNRRPSHVEALDMAGQEFTACIGFDPVTIISVPCKLALDYDLSEGSFKAADYKMAYE